MDLLNIAFIWFALIAAGGLLIATLITAAKHFPKLLPIGHGVGGFAALIFLLVVLMRMSHAPERAWWAFALFSASLAGGVVLFRLMFPGRAPLVLIMGHGIFGVAGLYLLWTAAF